MLTATDSFINDTTFYNLLNLLQTTQPFYKLLNLHANGMLTCYWNAKALLVSLCATGMLTFYWMLGANGVLACYLVFNGLWVLA